MEKNCKKKLNTILSGRKMSGCPDDCPFTCAFRKCKGCSGSSCVC